jgi:uncharacterized protein (TIRG00374 family)
MRRLETVIILLALGFYIWFLKRFGLSQVLHYVRLAGVGLVLAIVLESAARFMNTLGWRVTIVNYPKKLSFGELFIARISGEAIDYITPSAQLGGQFVMAMMVRRKLIMAAGLATVIVASLAEAMGQIGFISGALLVSVPFETRIHHLIWLMIAGLLIAIGLACGFFFIQVRRPFHHLWRIAARLEVRQLANPEIVAAADDADRRLISFYQHHKWRLLISSGCYLVAWSLGLVEIFIYLKFLGQHASWMIALMVEALGLLIERATFLIPGKLVSQEGGKALILSLLGYSADAGFAIGLLRRIKEMVWVLFGLVGMSIHRMVVERRLRPSNSEEKDFAEIQGAHGGESL